MPNSTTPTSREREVFRYFEPLEKSGASVYDRDHAASKASSDPVLTAFAQLGAHRLHAKRGLVTLSTRNIEYILAEASVGLSLQQGDDKTDPLWHGVTALKENTGLGMDLVKIFSGTEDDVPTYAVFNDLSKEDLFKHKRVVAEEPFVRFLACVPLVSPLHNLVIGTYKVLDDKPRDGLTESEIEFLLDMGKTVMDHLEAQRLNKQQHRAERMVKAIGLFIEGKSTLRDWWLEGVNHSQHSKFKKQQRSSITLEGQADLEFGVQDPATEFPFKRIGSPPDQGGRPTLSRSPSSSTLSHADRGGGGGDGRPVIPTRDSAFSSSDTTVQSAVFSPPKLQRSNSATTFDTTEGSATEQGVRHSSAAFDMPQDGVTPDLSKDLQEALLNKDLKAVFARASNLIREAGGVDGSIFFDASVGSFGGAAEKDVMSQQAPGSFHLDDAPTTSEDDVARRSSDTDTSNKATSQTGEAYCNILGFSTRKRSSIRGHTAPREHHMFPERVLRTLLKRYPHGKVFNFDHDGSFSSSDSDNAYLGKDLEPDSGPRRFSTHDGKARRKRITREAEAAALLSAFPGARSIFWFPLWDQNRERWYAGSLVWSTSATRILCRTEDLTYLAAFGNSIMAEVARLSALVLTQMKTDFISSISHELRSPLHGVLASVEFLQETPMSEVQADMVSNINASGRVLLDTINHVLDFSKVNRRVKDKGRLGKRKTGKKLRPPRQDQGIAEDVADICLVSEEVVESVYAGRKLSKLAYDASAGRQRYSRSQTTIEAPEQPVTVIMDIGWRPNWNFEIDSGAWRRILLNLFGNSMKYTKNGFIKVSLDVEGSSSSGKKARSMLVLRVKDSGKGISKEFLKNHLYKPFTQEDSLAVGAGLGLSIVRHIIQDLGGEIKFASEQGVGTEVTVKLPLSLTRQPKVDFSVSDIVDEVKAAAQGRKFVLEGFDRYPDISETPTGILSADFEGAMFLKSNIHTMLTDWFDMEPAPTQVLDKSDSDMVVLMESGIGALDETLQEYKNLRLNGSGPSTAIILCNDEYPSTAQLHVYKPLQVFYVPQPYGPHKLAKILHHAFCESEPEILERKLKGSEKKTPRAASTPTTAPTSITLPTRPVYEPSESHGSTTPTNENQVELSPAAPPQDYPDFDRKGSIITDVIRGEGTRALLVEDNEINLKLLVAYMRKLKIQHTTAINGLEALDAYKEAKGQFDVIFMDISMPIMSGIESTRHIRRFEREQGLNPVAVIALTGAANPKTRQEAFSGGVDLFLTKPVPMKSLKVMLEDLRSNGRKGLMG